MKEMFYGVDVSKDTLDIAWGKSLVRIGNNSSEIKAFVKQMPKGSLVALEATNVYHQEMADICFRAGMCVYVVNPRVTRRYREALSLRGGTDRISAKTLASFVEQHHGDLWPYVPMKKDHKRLQTLIRRRSKLVVIRTQLQQSLSGIKELKSDLKALLQRIKTMLKSMDLLIDRLLEQDEDRERIRSIKGVGPVVSAAVVTKLKAVEYESADAFVASCGLDPKPNESGKFRGRRRISKQGDRLTRSLLYTAAMAAVQTKEWKPIYQRYLDAGWTKVQSLVIIARKIAMCAWSIYQHKTWFDPSRICKGATAA